MERDEFWKQRCVRERNGFVVRGREELCALPGASRSGTWSLQPQHIHADAAGTELSERFNAQRPFRELGSQLDKPYRWKKHPEFPMPLPTPPGELADFFATLRPQSAAAVSHPQGGGTSRRSASTGALNPQQRRANTSSSEPQCGLRGREALRHTGSNSETTSPASTARQAPLQDARAHSTPASPSGVSRWTFCAGHRPW